MGDTVQSASREMSSRFLPQPLLGRIAGDPLVPQEPMIDSMVGAAIMADIVKFTTLANELPGSASEVGDALASIVNACFGSLQDTIAAHGGEVALFAGDAIAAVWPASDESQLADVTARALACADEIQRSVDEWHERAGGNWPLRVGVGCGDLYGVHVGGLDDRWYYVVAGQALLDAVDAATRAAPGSVVMSDAALRLIETELPTERLGDGYLQLTEPLLGLPGVVGSSVSSSVPNLAATPDAQSWQTLERYLPEQVKFADAAGQGEWLGDLRRVSVVFAKLLDVRPSRTDVLDAAQAAMLEAQRIFGRYEGFINQILVDDKGALIVAVFGVPPHSHEDDALRCVEAAQSLRTALAGLGQRVGIGLATGSAFVGPIGDRRRTYTVMGECMNLAARLMALAGDGIVADQATVDACAGRAEFDDRGLTELKGWAEPVLTFVPRAVHRRSGRAKHDGSGGRAIAGRQLERARLEAALDRLVAGQSGVVVLEGEAGLGKSVLAADVIRRAGERGMHVVVATGDAVHRTTPYHAWSESLVALLDMRDAAGWTVSERRERVRSALPEEDAAAGLAPLISALLPFNMDDQESTTVLMEGDDRSFATRQLVARLIRHQFGGIDSGRGVLFVLEDAHWFDPSSWKLWEEVAASQPVALTLAVTRPDGDAGPGVTSEIRDSAEVVTLESMDIEETADLIRRMTLADAVDDELVGFVAGRAEGNPLVIEELVLALTDADVIRTVDGVAALSARPDELDALSIPTTLQGIVTSRIDRLPMAHQLTVKVASVIGRGFEYVMLGGVHPTTSLGPDLRHELDELIDRGLTVLERNDPDLAFLFKHVIIQEVAYGLLPLDQRRRLHRLAATWLEEHVGDDRARAATDLARHWRSAGDDRTAMEYFSIAGATALHQGSYREAIASLRSAIESAELVGGVDNSVLADWEGQLAEAYHGLSELDSSIDHFVRALRLRGVDVPDSRAGRIRLIGQKLAEHALNHVAPSRRIGRTPTNSEDEGIAELCFRMNLVGYQRNDLVEPLVASCTGLATAEEIDEARYRAHFYSNLAVGASLARLTPLARRYDRAAMAALAQADDTTTESWVKQSLAWMRCGTGGDWETAQRLIDEGLAISSTGRMQRLHDEQLLVRAVSRWPESFAERARLWAVGTASGRRRGDREVQIWSGGIGASNLVAAGRVDEAIEQASSVVPLFRDSSARTGFVKVFGPLALGHHRAGHRQEALAALERAFVAVDEAQPILVSMFMGYADTVELGFELWQAGDESMEAPTRAALRKFAALARSFPAAQPRVVTFRARFDIADGNLARAERRLRRSCKLAQRVALPYEAALAQSYLAEIAATHGDREAADGLLDDALAVFDTLGAVRDVERAAHLRWTGAVDRSP